MVFERDPLGMEHMHHEGHITVCTARDCMYNEETRCMADSVMVNLHLDHADCNTYSKNEHVPGLTPGTSHF